MQITQADDITLDETERDHLLKLLDGLPLAIAQAGAYIQTNGSTLTKYVAFYEKQWDELMTPSPFNDPTLKDYPDRSVWTTWTISYQAIREQHEDTANLLLLWSFLHNKDLWYGLFSEPRKNDWKASEMLTKLIGNIASSEIQFTGAMRLLRNYSLVEEITGTTSYATHPVVHQWTRNSQGRQFGPELSKLAVVVVGMSVPRHDDLDYYTLQRRLLPHAQVCFNHVVETKVFDRLGAEEGADKDLDEFAEHHTILSALHRLGMLYCDQSKFSEAEELYNRALRGMENTLGSSSESTLRLIGDMGTLYDEQGKLSEAKKMYERALRGKEEVLGSTHTSTLETVNDLGILYGKQGKLTEEEKMLERALRVMKEVHGPDHPLTLQTVNNLGNSYRKQGKLAEGEKMYERALGGYEEVIGKEHLEHHLPALAAFHGMGVVYHDQRRLAKAENMYERAYRGYEETIGKDRAQQHREVLNLLGDMGILYEKQGEIAKAKGVWERAVSGYSDVLGPSSEECKNLVRKIERLSVSEKGREAGDERHHEEESAKQDQPKGEHEEEGHAALSTTNTVGEKQRRKREGSSSPSPQKPTKKTSRV
jgi:tetratricopeptide (TPR) repeat protein